MYVWMKMEELAPELLLERELCCSESKARVWVSVGTPSPLLKNIELQEKMYKHIFCFVCVYVLSEREYKS